jgi:signal transduction histidine kinase
MLVFWLGKGSERFTWLDAARSASGNGLGLSLVKAVIELHSVFVL